MERFRSASFALVDMPMPPGSIPPWPGSITTTNWLEGRSLFETCIGRVTTIVRDIINTNDMIANQTCAFFIFAIFSPDKGVCADCEL